MPDTPYVCRQVSYDLSPIRDLSLVEWVDRLLTDRGRIARTEVDGNTIVLFDEADRCLGRVVVQPQEPARVGRAGR